MLIIKSWRETNDRWEGQLIPDKSKKASLPERQLRPSRDWAATSRPRCWRPTRRPTPTATRSSSAAEALVSTGAASECFGGPEKFRCHQLNKKNLNAHNRSFLKLKTSLKHQKTFGWRRRLVRQLNLFPWVLLRNHIRFFSSKEIRTRGLAKIESCFGLSTNRARLKILLSVVSINFLITDDR